MQTLGIHTLTSDPDRGQIIVEFQLPDGKVAIVEMPAENASVLALALSAEVAKLSLPSGKGVATHQQVLELRAFEPFVMRDKTIGAILHLSSFRVPISVNAETIEGLRALCAQLEAMIDDPPVARSN